MEKSGQCTLVRAASPITMTKAIKSSVEVSGLRECHRRDGAAMCRWLMWLDQVIVPGSAVKVTEVSAATRLAELRAEQAHFRGLSFETISAVGANGATIHYRPGGGVTDPAVTTQEMYLCDSGAQYLDGTTKIHNIFSVAKYVH